MTSQSVADNVTLPSAGGASAAPLRDVALDDKDLATSGRVFQSGLRSASRHEFPFPCDGAPGGHAQCSFSIKRLSAM